MNTQSIGLMVIGDEILSGKRQDKHLNKVIELLAARGMELSWVRVLSDDGPRLRHALEQTFGEQDLVLSCGGIGATPDDRTRQAVAEALGLPLELHPQGYRELVAQFDQINAQRLKLVEFPRGAALIPNPVNRVPGFSIRDHHFVPGFPSMAWPMIEWVLDHRYASLQAPGRLVEQAIIVWDAWESDVIPFMESFENRHPDLRLSCLPGSLAQRSQLEMGLRGSPERVLVGMVEMKAAFESMGFEWTPVELPRL